MNIGAADDFQVFNAAIDASNSSVFIESEPNKQKN